MSIPKNRENDHSFAIEEVIPAKMRELDEWVVRDSKKLPHSPHTQKLGKTFEPGFTASLEVAEEVAKKHSYPGVGFVFTDRTDEFVFIDIDDCIDEHGKPSELAREVLKLCPDTYAEVSPSGAGVHIFGHGLVAGKQAIKEVGFEVYAINRYSTVTGRVLEGRASKWGSVQKAIDYLQKERDKRRGKVVNLPRGKTPEGGRNNALFDAGIKEWKSGTKTPEELLAWIKDENKARNTPPLPDHEVESVWKSICRYDHETPQGDRRRRKNTASSQDYIDLLKETFPDKLPRRDIISDKLMVFHNRKWIPVATKGSLPLSILANRARKSEGRFNHTALFDEYREYESSLPGELLLDIPEWDGVPRWRGIIDCLNAACFTKEQTYELLIDFLVTAHRKIFNPKIQNKVLILQGAQGIGKDMFLSTILSMYNSVSGYVSTVLLKPNMPEEDWGRFLCSSIFANFPEFDRVRGGDATFKAMTTAETVSWVHKYEEGLTEHLVRASITASVNPKDINIDPTGARRFLFIELKGKPHSQCQGDEVPAIRWDYLEAARNPGQLLAEIVEIAKTWAGVSGDTAAALKEVQARITPQDDVEVAIDQVFGEYKEEPDSHRAGIERVTIGGIEVHCQWASNDVLKPLILKAAAANGVGEKAIRNRLQTEGYYKRGNKGVRGYYIPVLLSQTTPSYSDTQKTENETLSHEFDPMEYEGEFE